MNLENLKELINGNDAVMVYFSGKECGVCEALKPKVKSLMQNKFDRVKQVYIDAKQNQQTAANYNVFSIPTIIVFLDKKEFIRKSRNISLLEFEKELQRPYSLYFN